MSYKCLRNCFVADRMYYKDVVYDLADNIPTDPKNFQNLDEIPEEEKPEVEVKEPATPWLDPEKPCQCPICGYGAKNKAGLKLHMKKHTPKGRK